VDQELHILRAVETVNKKQKEILGKKIVARFGANLSGRRFAIWGLAFKPNTDDMRQAPSLALLHELIGRGASLALFDPVAMHEARRILANDGFYGADRLARIRFCDSPMQALQDADALAIVTEWKAFRSPDFEQVRKLLKHPIIFDGRNLFEPSIMIEANIEYHGIGRSSMTRKNSNDPVANTV
jgi:UDPglucose 6-dehydrogenase